MCNHCIYDKEFSKGEYCILCGEVLSGYVFEENIKNCLHKFAKHKEGYKCIYCEIITNLNPKDFIP